MFVENAWYVAAISSEIGRDLTPVRILDHPIVLFRREDGGPVALDDACPHRKLPLSMGRLQGDTVECGYHGLRFDGRGRCVRVPATPSIADRIGVRSWPVVDRYGLLWIWTGAAEAADPDEIFRVEHWDDPDWGRTQPGSMSVDCNWLYITDNLLDPSHVAWVHPTSFGNAACEEIPVRPRETATSVVASRWMMDVEVAPFYAPFTKFAGNADREQHYEVHLPAHASIKAIFVPAGTGGPDRPLHPDVFLMDSLNFMTPVDAKRTRYFWFQMRNFAAGDAAVDAAFATAVKAAFEEDRVVLAAVQAGMDSAEIPAINLPIDAAPIRFRRRIAERIAAETAAMDEKKEVAPALRPSATLTTEDPVP